MYALALMLTLAGQTPDFDNILAQELNQHASIIEPELLYRAG